MAVAVGGAPLRRAGIYSRPNAADTEERRRQGNTRPTKRWR